MAQKLTAVVKHTKKTYRGKDNFNFVGSFEDGNNTILISIASDEDGNIKRYTNPNGRNPDREMIYLNVVKFPTSQKKEKNTKKFK